MNILDRIVAVKKKEVAARKVATPIKALETAFNFQRETISLADKLRAEPGVIAEFKRKSPSRSNINLEASVADVAKGYLNAGAAAMSVLTDVDFFGGSDGDLADARSNSTLPILRKDFTIDEYQVIESKAIGADLILLIAAVLTPEEVKHLAGLARQLGLEVLLEVHNEEELDRSLNEHVSFVGVNNRNLKTFEVSIETSLRLGELIPEAFLKISESGISNPESIVTLRDAGYNGFLVGECFMKTNDPGKACREMIDAIMPSPKFT